MWAVRFHAASRHWRKLFNDKWIHDVVQGFVLVFDKWPMQRTLPRPLTFSVADTFALDTAIRGFIRQKIVEICTDADVQGFFSNVFPVIKADGSARVILNLRDLNEYITHVHFKMESITDVINLVQPNFFYDC